MPTAQSRSIIARLRAAGCVFAEDEARLLISAAPTAADLNAMVGRRAGGEPLEQVLGWAEFCGLRIEIDPGVFVPRRRTELMVRQGAAHVRKLRASSKRGGRPVIVVDMCCGSGALGAALAARVGGIELYAVDIDERAVNCARRNIAPAGGGAYHGDLFEPLPELLRGRVDVLLANAPYVPSEAIALLPPEARLYEPLTALNGGADGLDIVRRISAEAGRWLARGGNVMVEASHAQAQQLGDVFRDDGMTSRIIRSPALDATIVVAAPAN